MDVVGYEKCRVVRFASAFRPQGAPFTPETFAKIIARYNFAKYPTLDDLQKDGPSIFQIGKFQDVQIDDFGIYTDGYSAAGRCSTVVLDSFLDDVAAWGTKEFGLTFIMPHRDEMYYESNLIVQSKVDLASVFRPKALQVFTEALTKGTGFKYAPSGMELDCDPPDVNASNRRRKPWRFFIERRIGFPFKENLFLCQAPIPTGHHLDLLATLEGELLDDRV